MVARTDVIFRGRVISIVSLLKAEPRDLRGMSEDEARSMVDRSLARGDRVLVDLAGEFDLTENAALFATATNLTDESTMSGLRPLALVPARRASSWAG